MTVISIIGTSGVGKSLLVRQLAALENAPCFLEGEEGVIPPEIMEKITDRSDPIGLFNWFAGRYKRNLENAHDLAKKCYVDGAIMSIEAHIIEQDATHHATLRMLLDDTAHLESDKTLLLVADENKLRHFLNIRGRRTEQTDAMLKRSMLIQDEFLRIAERERDVIVLDRSELDFHRIEDLRVVQNLLGGRT